MRFFSYLRNLYSQLYESFSPVDCVPIVSFASTCPWINQHLQTVNLGAMQSAVKGLTLWAFKWS